MIAVRRHRRRRWRMSGEAFILFLLATAALCVICGGDRFGWF